MCCVAEEREGRKSRKSKKTPLLHLFTRRDKSRGAESRTPCRGQLFSRHLSDICQDEQLPKPIMVNYSCLYSIALYGILYHTPFTGLSLSMGNNRLFDTTHDRVLWNLLLYQGVCLNSQFNSFFCVIISHFGEHFNDLKMCEWHHRSWYMWNLYTCTCETCTCETCTLVILLEVHTRAGFSQYETHNRVFSSSWCCENWSLLHLHRSLDLMVPSCPRSPQTMTGSWIQVSYLLFLEFGLSHTSWLIK